MHIICSVFIFNFVIQVSHKINCKYIKCTLKLRNTLKQLHTWNPFYCLMKSWTFLMAQMVKNLPLTQETQAWSLGWDTLEKRMATHSSILAWRIPRTESLVGYSPWGRRVGYDWVTNTFTFTMKFAQKQSFENYTIWKYQALSLM